VATADNPESFLAKHGGKDKVLADADLKRAYEERVRIREAFLDLMREGYKRRKAVAPFDRGEKAELAGTTTRKLAAPAVALAPVLTSPEAEAHWPRFRGPTGQGETFGARLPLHWDKDGKNIVWRTPVPGRGHSSPIVWGDRIFLTTAAKDGRERQVLCYRRSDGHLLWTRTGPARTPETGLWPKNSYATATPVTDGERVIAFLGASGLVCLDFEGKLLWQNDELTVNTTHGPGSSPLLYKDLVILAQDQNRADSLFLAVDKKTGKTVWEAKRPRAMTWTTPVVVRAGEHDEMLIAGGGVLRSYDPSTGKELWSLTGPTIEVVPTIVIGKELVYCASGRNGPTLGLRVGGQGDMTEKNLAWRTVRGGPHVPSPILVDGRLYTFNDTGIATCLDAATGALLYQHRINDRFSASPIVADGRIYVSGESGITYVVQAGAKFQLLARNDLGTPIFASPAAVGQQLILRTESDLVCISGPTD
jgi:outer membrane protein assembly factor BamB